MKDSNDTCDATPQWSAFIENERSIRLSTWIVMTSFSDIANSARVTFARHGVPVITYEQNGYWRSVLTGRLLEHYVNRSVDFLIICALQKERAGFETVGEIVFGEQDAVAGLNCRFVSLGKLTGVILVLPEPGLISAAIATAKAASIFRPRQIAMTGICGGMASECALGDLIVPDVAWNYQTGKIVANGLVPELMQIPVPPKTKTSLQQMATNEISASLRAGLFHSELRHGKIHVEALVSGSPVIADDNEALKIASQSRKIFGLDMEVAAVYAAAHDYFDGGGIFFAAKTVVDLASSTKDDRYHEYGCALAARFAARSIVAFAALET